MATRSSSCSSLSMNNVFLFESASGSATTSTAKHNAPPPRRRQNRRGEHQPRDTKIETQIWFWTSKPKPIIRWVVADETRKLSPPPSATATHGQTAPFCKPAPPLRQTAPKMMAFERTTFQWGGGIWRSECRRSDEGVLLLRLILDLKTQTQYQICWRDWSIARTNQNDSKKENQ